MARLEVESSAATALELQPRAEQRAGARRRRAPQLLSQRPHRRALHLATLGAGSAPPLSSCFSHQAEPPAASGASAAVKALGSTARHAPDLARSRIRGEERTAERLGARLELLLRGRQAAHQPLQRDLGLHGVDRSLCVAVQRPPQAARLFDGRVGGAELARQQRRLLGARSGKRSQFEGCRDGLERGVQSPVTRSVQTWLLCPAVRARRAGVVFRRLVCGRLKLLLQVGTSPSRLRSPRDILARSSPAAPRDLKFQPCLLQIGTPRRRWVTTQEGVRETVHVCCSRFTWSRRYTLTQGRGRAGRCAGRRGAAATAGPSRGGGGAIEAEGASAPPPRGEGASFAGCRRRRWGASSRVDE